MNILDISLTPTVVKDIHESVFRSYHILRLVKFLLKCGTPGKVVLALIEEIETLPQKLSERDKRDMTTTDDRR